MEVPFYKHNLGKEELESIKECLQDNILTTGRFTDEFEDRFSKFVRLNYCVGLQSCTDALFLSLIACGIGKGDKVITTPLTYIATVLAIIHTGATPVFVDVEEDTGMIDPINIEEAIDKYTKAIVPVNLYGSMCDMESIGDIATEHNLYVIEDSAHCLNIGRSNIKPGQLSIASAYSFYGTKPITCGEGGAVCSNDKLFINKIRLLSQHGVNKNAFQRLNGSEYWDLVEFGYKSNMSNIQAAILLAQLRKLHHSWFRKKIIDDNYRLYLNNEVDFLKVKGGSSEYHLSVILVNQYKRDLIVKYLKEKGISTTINYKSISELNLMKVYFNKSMANAELIGRRCISLPNYFSLTDEKQNYVIENVKKAVKYFN